MRDFHNPGRSVAIAENGMCATSHPLAAQVAVRMMQDGGNAMDAAIAAAVLLGICEPQMTGIGGDLFCLFKRPGEDRIRALNASGKAPSGLAASTLRKKGFDTIPLGSAHSVTTPGAVHGFCQLNKDHGALSLEQVLAPAIHYAEHGVPVAPRVAFDWANSADRLQGEARNLFLLNGKAAKTGQIFRAPAQAETLKKIARAGADGFYQGEVAKAMVAALLSAGGTHTLEDFAATTSEYVDPISGLYRGYKLFEHPPNTQGATAILIGNILSNFELAKLDPVGADRIHLTAEAAKLAYDARDRFIADPDHTARLDHLLSQKTADQLAGLIDPKRAMADPRKRSEAIHKDTVYLTVVDKDRMAVSMIYSIFHSFGSGLADPVSGVLFQNRGAGFTLEKGHPNEANPGKRPMHTIIPAMLERPGKYLMPFGVMGGAYQPVGHAHVVGNLVDFGMNPQQAIDCPRSFSDQGVLKLEAVFPDETKADLKARGHEITVPVGPLGGGQAILIDDDLGVLVGGSDHRKDGAAIGY